MRRCENVRMCGCEDEDEKMRRCEDVMIRICENVKMFDRPPLLEEPFAQTLSEKLGNWNWKLVALWLV